MAGYRWRIPLDSRVLRSIENDRSEIMRYINRELALYPFKDMNLAGFRRTDGGMFLEVVADMDPELFIDKGL